ncbi:MAG: hypothetical protein LBL01_00975 [Bifidobacteriaceae bacterium]|nr:hypothetical protein [Bifidobacteriaceae bacterium]
MTKPPETATARQLAAALRAALAGARFPFPGPAWREAQRRVEQALAETAAADTLPEPPVIALAGGTGVGKSALANALAGKALSPAGPLRPTTRVPRLLATPATAALLGDHPALDAAQLVLDHAAAPAWAFLDCADPFQPGNDPAGAQPDVPVSAWLVVTSALRYGDALLWDLLRSVGGPDTPVALVVNRLPPGAWEQIRPDAARRLAEAGLDAVDLLPVAQADGAPDLIADADGVEQVRAWLADRWPPASMPDPHPLLASLASAAVGLARDQELHTRTVALLRQVTRDRAAALAQAARTVPGPPGQPPNLPDAVPSLIDAARQAAWRGMTETWRGGAVPAGTGELLTTPALCAPPPPGTMPHAQPPPARETALDTRPDAHAASAVGDVAPGETLGAPGLGAPPAEGSATLGDALAAAAVAALAPFEEAVNQLDQGAAPGLPHLARALAAAAARGATPDSLAEPSASLGAPAAWAPGSEARGDAPAVPALGAPSATGEIAPGALAGSQAVSAAGNGALGDGLGARGLGAASAAGERWAGPAVPAATGGDGASHG